MVGNEPKLDIGNGGAMGRNFYSLAWLTVFNW